MIISGTTLASFLKSVSKPVKAVSTRERPENNAKTPETSVKTDDHKKGKLHIFKGFNVDIPVDDAPAPHEEAPSNDIDLDPKQLELVEKYNDDDAIDQDAVIDEISESEKAAEKKSKPKPKKKESQEGIIDFDGEIDLEGVIPSYKYPPYDLLNKTSSSDVKALSKELDNTAERLVEVLKSFGVETRVLDISRGPTVTRYELQPCAGVKISKITGLADDIALNLATAGVRIEAPIPNKAAVGIEVPNRASAVVGVREIIESSSFSASKSKLTIALGRDIGGNVIVGDIAKMPHGLIAGATGSGKSVCINSIIMSILYKSSPEEVKLLMVDPKVVELGVYNGIPHLLVPVVTDPKKAAGALGWAVMEMEKRYAMFADRGVRDIDGYNRFVDTLRDEPEVKRLPHIVIIIDELADLMMTAPNEVEDSINRIAAKARAAGMHLLIATQRPSVDVLTGVIKANIPTRIAFAVSSQIDSRTILDSSGAEKLLGKGDMLYSPLGSTKPKRVQGCYVSDKEIQKVVDYVKKAANPDYDDDIMYEIERQAALEKSKKTGLPEDAPGDDPLLNDAILCVIEMGQASTSLLQRKLKLGYARAARIVDEMEARGVVGPYEGSKPRKVLITKDQFMEQQATASDDE
ncbi:MAG: DNA translocase FtsK [Clostridia bacterium]|nr:DNA translocase FtsK [Clostridia bacterium]